MKTYKAIWNDIKKINTTIDELYKAAQDENTPEKWSEYEAARIKKGILRDNFRYVLGLAGLEALKEITKKYDGKPCGEVTNKTICKEMKRRGFSFYFGGRYSWDRTCYTATIQVLGGTGYGYGDEATLYACKTSASEASFIDSNNKICYAAIEGATIGGAYCDNIPKRVRDIQKTYNKFCAALTGAADLQSELNHILPSTYKHINNVNRYLYGLSES